MNPTKLLHRSSIILAVFLLIASGHLSARTHAVVVHKIDAEMEVDDEIWAIPVDENNSPHDEPSDYDWNGQRSDIVLNGTSATSSSAGVTKSGSTITISAAGTYILSGTLTDGQIIVDTPDVQSVRLVLNGIDITNSKSAAIYVANAQKTITVFADNATNSIKDGSSYVFPNADVDEPNRVVKFPSPS